MTFTVPGRPVAKGRPRFGNGRAYTPQTTKDHEQLVRQYAVAAKLRPVDGPVELSCVFYCDRALDGDNALKLIGDALQPPRGVPAGIGNAYANDRQVTKWHADVIYDKTNPRTVITITPVEDA